MENSFQQAGNLDGVFEIGNEDIPNEPVFLVDDVVDSGWTMTIIGTLFRQAVCPAVFPLSLSLSTHSFRDR